MTTSKATDVILRARDMRARSPRLARRTTYLLGEGPTMRDGEPATEIDPADAEDYVEIEFKRIPADERWFVRNGSKTHQLYNK